MAPTTGSDTTLTGRPASARTLVHALGIGQICSWGTLFYSFPLIAQAMGADLGWGKAELYGAATLGLFLAALLAYPVGLAIDRGHGRWVMGLASLLAAALLVMWAQVTSLLAFYLIVPAVGALQAATLYEPAFAVMARRVGPARARSGITALTLWGGFASTLFVPLVQWLLDQWGWRDALLVLAGVNGVVCAGAYLIFIQPSRDALVSESVSPGQIRERNRRAVQEALHQPVFWALLLSFTAYAAVFSAFTFHMYPLFLERGMDTTSVVQAIALFGPAQVAGRVAISLLARRSPIRMIGSLVVAVFPLVFAALALVQLDFHSAAVICIVYGAMNGIFTIVRGMVVPEMLSPHAYGAINGLLTVSTTLARAIAPAGAAALWALGGSYQVVLYAIVAGAVMTAIAFWIALVYRRTKSVWLA